MYGHVVALVVADGRCKRLYFHTADDARPWPDTSPPGMMTVVYTAKAVARLTTSQSQVNHEPLMSQSRAITSQSPVVP